MSGFFDDFLIRAALAGAGVALAAGPLGCFVVWRRMAYFGDATAHSALLGVALGLALQLPVALGAFLTALASASAVAALSDRGGRSGDAMLGVVAHGALAFGLVAVSLTPGVRVDLMGYLFGDILAVGVGDLGVIWGGAAFTLTLLAWRWRPLLNMVLSPALAVAEGGRPWGERAVLTVMMALTIAIGMQVVGVLLVTAMLILPAAAARPVSATPEAMALWAALIGVVGALSGIGASFQWDTPTGPSIVCCLIGCFALTVTAATVLRSIARSREAAV